MNVLGFLFSWLVAGGIICWVGRSALKQNERYSPVRSSSRIASEAEGEGAVRRSIIAAPSLDQAAHPDLLGVDLEESFQRWAEQQKQDSASVSAAPNERATQAPATPASAIPAPTVSMVSTVAVPVTAASEPPQTIAPAKPKPAPIPAPVSRPRAEPVPFDVQAQELIDKQMQTPKPTDTDEEQW